MIEKDGEFSIAVIGLSARVPGSQTIEEFWENLVNEKESISFFTDDELLQSKIEKELIDKTSYIKAKGVIGNSEYFDASFFGYSPREAEFLDPQHRVFLECAWHAMEDAGYAPYKTDLKIGIFGGTGVPGYHLAISKNPEPDTPSTGMSIIISNEKDYLTTRVAHRLNLTGTSVTVQCACSTSLTAIVLGMQSLLMHQNDMVLCGGVSITYPEKQGYLYEKGSLDSPDGHCRTFDAGALGTVFSSGAGVVVLKRYSDAIRDRDHIYCILKGGSINNDGGTKSSYTAPSVEGQVAVEVDALEMAGVSPESITYVEAHGTATQIGDPIEIKALTQAFRQYTSKNKFCAIGSVKTNIGHTDVASGVIGLIKVALSMENKKIPASLHFETPNPEIDFENSPFYVNTKTKKWKSCHDFPRRAIINSFGVGGANACVVLEEAPKITSDISKKSQLLLLLSAKTSTALETMSSQVLNYVKSNANLCLADLTYTFQIGRTLMDHRKFISFSNRDELIDALLYGSDFSTFSLVSSEKEQTAIFMFPGQGNQYLGMGKSLYQCEPFFQKEVDSCCKILEKLGYEYDLKEKLFNFDDKCGKKELINQTLVTQPALFVIEYSLARFIMFLGIRPKALIGHSIGEIVAACVSGVIAVEDALKVVIERARITQRLEKGSMLAVFSGYEEVSKWVQYPNEISVINSPNLIVISGPIDDISALENELSSRKISCKRLNTSHAFHSHMMDPSIEPLMKIISSVKLSPPTIPIMSSVTGQWMKAEEAQDSKYWSMHARNPVNFLAAALRLTEENNHFFIEVGPGHSLESAIKNCAPSPDIKIIGLLGSVNNPIPDDKVFHIALGKIWAYGGTISFEILYENEKRRRIPLPGYPFERTKYLLSFTGQRLGEKASGKKESLEDWFYVPSWKKSQSLHEKEDIDLSNSDDLWIIFSNGDVVASLLIEELIRANQTVISVEAADVFKEETSLRYFINPQNPDDYFKFFEKVKEKKAKSHRIIHLWNLTQNSKKFPSLKEIDHFEEKSFYGLLYLNKTLIKFNLFESLYINFVADNVYNVMNNELNIFNSLIIGPCRVFKNEYPKIQSRLIDVPYPQNDSDLSSLVKTLILENLHISDEIVVAYRNFSRWTPTYEKKSLPLKGFQRRSFREGGVYLITGGTGAIGLNLAKFIAENVNAKIILIHRTPMPNRSEWKSLLNAPPVDDEISEKIKKVQEIEALGSEVILMQADVSLVSEMEQLVRSLYSSYSKINGVFHCAGVPGGGIISLKTPEMAANVLKTKVRGTLILEKLLKKQDLDFFISCSSITGILGEKGQIDYCSANAFLDAFSNSRNALRPGVYSSINWGAWDAGMAVKNSLKDEFHNKKTMTPYVSIYLNRLQPLSVKKNEEKYQVLLDPQQDWFINNHKLNGIPTLVGTAFFEFLMEYIKEKESNAVLSISNVQFVSPLMYFPKIEKILKLNILKKDNVFKFTFFSQSREIINDHMKGQEHLYGEMSLQNEKNDEAIDLDQLMGRLKKVSKIRDVYGDDLDAFLWVGPRWKSVIRVFKGDREWVAHLSLSNTYYKEIETFNLHPALFDIATSFCVPYFVDNFYLPYSYEKVIVFSPLENEIFSYARQNNTSEGFISLDIDLLNTKGEVLVRIEGYTLKSVSEDSRSTRFKDSKEAKLENISPSEGVEAFKRFFYQLTSPQIIIYPGQFNDVIKENEPSVETEDAMDGEILLKHSRPQLFTPYVEPSNEIEKAVASIWEAILGISQIGIDDNFIELGGNSLNAIQAVAQLTEMFKVEFDVDSFISNPTIRTLSDFILNNLIDLIDKEELNLIVSSIDE